MGCRRQAGQLRPALLPGQSKLMVDLAETILLRQGDTDFLAGIDQIRILDHFPIGFENLRIVSRIAQELLGDSGQRISNSHFGDDALE